MGGMILTLSHIALHYLEGHSVNTAWSVLAAIPCKDSEKHLHKSHTVGTSQNPLFNQRHQEGNPTQKVMFGCFLVLDY